MQDGRARITARTPDDVYGPVSLGLRGEHQVGNALVAIRLLEIAMRRGVHVTRDAIERGLSAAEWPARLELLPVAPGRGVLLDAAHNVEGAEALAAYLSKWHPERPPLVIGVMADKDVAGILRALLPVTSSIVATAVTEGRALPPGNIAAIVRTIDAARPVAVEEDPQQAIARAFDAGNLVCVAGSIYLAGAVRDALKRRAILH
jgi:dihydrofolate synthase / folylpolyglutamate synthase